jgi:murein DD-endopeptidase MepM/ murein hydrolase activator NlpD
MARTRYKYNPHTCRYEPFYIRGKQLRQRIAMFFSTSLIIATGAYFATIQYFESLDEFLLTDKNQQLKVEWNVLHERIRQANSELANYIAKDDNNYRVILDSSPLPPSIREAGTGGSEKISIRSAEAYPFIVEEYHNLQELSHKLDVEIQSFDELDKILDAKMMAWAARPAIQPISNTQLDRLHLTFGARLHPIFKVWRDHKGLDFTAATGTPVYATGDGEVQTTHYSESFGKVIYIDHGYDFQTRYAHLSAYAVIPGEPVKRGQLIGYVGNTGHSVSAHLHYEVLFKGEQVNPINFFQRDLSNEEYQRLIDIGSQNSTPLD